MLRRPDLLEQVGAPDAGAGVQRLETREDDWGCLWRLVQAEDAVEAVRIGRWEITHIGDRAYGQEIGSKRQPA